jgi:hypothetical protein
MLDLDLYLDPHIMNADPKLGMHQIFGQPDIQPDNPAFFLHPVSGWIPDCPAGYPAGYSVRLDTRYPAGYLANI